MSAAATALLQPIPGASSPGGEDAKYDPRHEALRAEVGKLDSPVGGEVQWETVVSSAQELLTAASKDLLVASYLAAGLLETQGLDGLATGLGVMQGLLGEYWETLHPPLKRMRGRAGALEWLMGRLEARLPALNPTEADRPALDAVLAAHNAIGTSARDRMGDAAPAMSPVGQLLQRMDMAVPRSAPPTAVPEPEPVPEPGANPGPGAATPAPAGDAGANPGTSTSTSTSTNPGANPGEPAPSTEGAAPAAAAAPAEPPAGPTARAEAEAAALLAPISAAAPAGEDARYDSDYEAARAEVGKADSLEGGQVDWANVAKLCGGLLQTRSKDVLIASYLAYAKLEEAGLPELCVGLAVVAGLFESFETRWPKRPRGQGNAAAWLTEHLERKLSTYKATPKDREALQELGAWLRRCGGAMRESLEDHAPRVRPLEDRVQRLLLSMPKEEEKKPPPPPPKPTPAQPAAATPKPAPVAAPAGMPSAVADVSSAEEVTKYLQETGRSLVKVAGILRRAQLHSAGAYRLLRLGLYLHLDAPPPSDAGGKTNVPAFPENRRTQFETIAKNAKWPALLEETESALVQFRFCLDLHRMSAEALDAIGDPAKAALRGLIAEVGAAVRRMPAWPDLTAADGSPLANAATREWLSTVVASSPGGAAASGSAAGPDAGDDPEAFKDVAALMKGGKAAEAVARAKASIDEASHPRHRFARRLALARQCLEGGQEPLARGIFQDLQAELDERGLADWEPQLSAAVLEGLVRSIRAVKKKGVAIDPTTDAAFQRLCRVDPVAAARVS